MMEVVGFGLITSVLLLNKTVLNIPNRISIFLIFAILTLSLYLLPVPTAVWLHLPGRTFYQEIVTLLDTLGQGMTHHPISLDAYATSQSLLALLPPLAVFIGTITLSRQRLGWLTGIVLTIATVQALWGIIQYAHTGMARGSYTNRDHFAGLMELTLPIAISLLVWRHSSRVWLGIYAVMAGSILLAGLFSLSRAGIGGLALAVLLSLIVFSGRLPLWRIVAGVSLFLAFAVLVSGSNGFIPIINRFLAVDPLEDVRWVMFDKALQAAELFFPLGSGPGTFNDIYTAFQPIQETGWGVLDHAHNDYLELLFETGIVGIAILTGFLGIFLFGLITLWRQRQDEQFYLKAGAAIGIVTALFHAFFDFNFHTPMYPVFFAYLSGVFLSTFSKSDQYHRLGAIKIYNRTDYV